ncbi:NlpC/P60 family protein [Bacillus sp. JCM 19041]|uniref:C40 family peptidase n=1 Tax=Bacillus sp. JCM 19041 TaxID=1460637 RepID=UPI0006D24913
MSGFGYDCSGFVYTMHKASEIIIPRDASNQVQTGVEVKDEEMTVGDLLYFAHEKGEGDVHHVAMYAGNGEMIHAPKTGKAVEQIPIYGTVYEQEHCATRRFTSKALWRDFS